MLIDKNNMTSMKLLWDCEFYYKLITGFIEANDNRTSTLLSAIILRECTVFIQEMSLYLPIIEEAILSDCSNLFKNSYQIIRNRVHYFTSQPFDYLTEKSNAENMIRKIQKHSLTRPVDDMSAFRYDLSYIKVENMLCFSNIDVAILFEGTSIENKGNIIGHALKQYSTDLARIISSMKQGIANTDLKYIIKLEDLIPNNEEFTVEFFDGKFDVAVEKQGFTEFLTIISLRILSDIGSLQYMVSKLFDAEWRDSYHLYFFTRLIAIRFDEISDAIYKIDTDFPEGEAVEFISSLKSRNIYPFPEDIRLIAKKMRNSIHYNSSNEIWNIDLEKQFYWYDNFLKQASTKNTNLTVWPDDYMLLKDKMLAHLDLLHKWFSEVFDYELKFAVIEPDCLS